ncbi:uncharacterized protein RHOBADRAFT_55394 [Rhodotorula graminis WP1]|uniref:Protection of telomeres protein 1 ssDNA-binding domain-containing protein n=1 Tax=Rhodotorula graminis (strain WP1) TaxID=578459 RepID=A0A0P9IUN8_RHOGW|nr:uncharacterized protein RHOBADRAFT_55394 [Rhodotorula graminis WP1]KPV73183.1 hypothetical protein RHOBADRAFT_55394 [Rhodotorula graminis WP1]
MPTTARRPLEPVPLSTLASSSPSSSSPHGVVRGRLTKLRPYSPHTRLAQLTLASIDPGLDTPGTAIDVELKGDVALLASRRLRKGDIVILATKGASTAPGKSTGNGHGERRAGWVRFDELTGWIRRKNGDDEFLHFAQAAKSTAPHARPRPSAPPPPVLPPAPPPPLAAAPSAKRPRTSTSPRPSVPAKVSPPGQGHRARKRLKAAAAADALASWGLTAVDGTRYTPLDQLGPLVAQTPKSALLNTVVNVVALVTHAGRPSEPMSSNRDWYRPILVVDPTRPGRDAPLEIQWYAKTAAALPDVQPGDVVLARNLVLKAASTPGAPILLARAFAVVPHAPLRPAALLASPPPRPGAAAATAAPTARPSALEVAPDELAYAARVVRACGEAAGPNEGEGGAAGAETRPMLPPSLADGARPRASAGGGGARGGRPLLRVEEMSEGQFCDLIGMVTKIHCPSSCASLPPSSAASLYLTDYTRHPLLHDYASPSAVGLAGQLVLQLSVFGAQAQPLSALVDHSRTGQARRGALVHVRNVRVKRGTGGALEGTLWEERDARYRDRRDVTVVDLRRRDHEERWGARARDVQRRHREYWAARSRE